jgi:uncharacterized protein YbjT (DUF2867 family)
MHVAVFGATGFVGSYLIDALVNSGHEPSVLVRPGSENKLRHADRCRTNVGDLNSTSAINATLVGCDAIVFSVGILREYPKKGITFQNLQLDAVVRVAESAKLQNISRLLLVSANGVKVPGTSYQETKFRAEEYVNGAFDFTIFRPSVIFGDPRGTMEIATQLLSDMIDPPLPALGFFAGWNPVRGAVLMSPVHVEDVALAIVAALDDPSTIGRTYELAGPEILTWQEMIHRIARTVGKRKWIVPMPIGLMRLAAALLDWLPGFPVTRDQLTMLAEGNTADPHTLQELIGKPPRGFDSQNLVYLKG